MCNTSRSTNDKNHLSCFGFYIDKSIPTEDGHPLASSSSILIIHPMSNHLLKSSIHQLIPNLSKSALTSTIFPSISLYTLAISRSVFSF